MLVAARRAGAVATVLPGTLEDLLREIAAGHPVVTLSNLGLSWAPSWHYAVAVGYDLDAGELLLRSGPMKRQQMALRTFEHTWARGRHWAFVALPPGKLPATALESDAARALVAFERNAPPEKAALAYAAGLQRWPDNLVLAIGLGNASYAARDLPGAEKAFRHAAGRHASAAAWNNLAVVLDEQGRRSEAVTAARKAVELSGADDAGPRETLRRLTAG
jgi:tetratricopeptide (TPR) repeat protein